MANTICCHMATISFVLMSLRFGTYQMRRRMRVSHSRRLFASGEIVSGDHNLSSSNVTVIPVYRDFVVVVVVVVIHSVRIRTKGTDETEREEIGKIAQRRAAEQPSE